MANEILIIGVGSAGIISADKMDLPYSKRLFVDTDYRQLEAVKSEGGKSCCSAKIMVHVQASAVATPNLAFAR